MTDNFHLIERLYRGEGLMHEEYLSLIRSFNPALADFAAKKADEVRRRVYGGAVYIRGLIEISNYCKNGCLYCGIRAQNSHCQRYRLTSDEILQCCDDGYSLGFRTFVLQGGEDPNFNDEILVEIISEIKYRHPDCAVTLSLGERTRESYARLRAAGADRYLLRHETINPEHYSRLHTENLSHKTRMECLKNLKELGFGVGSGFMVGSPFQTDDDLALELEFVAQFRPDMCGIGPFLPHRDTPFRDKVSGSVNMTCFLLSLIRLIHPTVLLPATTALGTADADGRERGLLSGANVIMPNLSPTGVRQKYELYNNKLHSGAESAEEIENLKEKCLRLGYKIVTDRGDRKEIK